jgi:hypothetical protein
MAKPIVPKSVANAVFISLSVGSLFYLVYHEIWWPSVLLALWLSLSARQLLTGRKCDFALTSAVLLSLYVTESFALDYALFVPVVLSITGVYILFRELFYGGCTRKKEKKLKEVQVVKEVKEVKEIEPKV